MSTFPQRAQGAGAYSTHKGQDVINAIAGIWLFFTPFFIAHAAVSRYMYAASLWNAVIVGALLFIVSVVATTQPNNTSMERTNVVLAVWAFLSPWILGFAAFSAMAYTCWVIGIVVFCLALWAGSNASSQGMTTVPGEDMR